jgi:hypothetical protein
MLAVFTTVAWPFEPSMIYLTRTCPCNATLPQPTFALIGGGIPTLGVNRQVLAARARLPGGAPARRIMQETLLKHW